MLVRYTVRRLIEGAITLWIVGSIVFLLMNMLGDPVSQLLPTDHTAEEYEALRHLLGYDRPLVVRYGEFLFTSLTGDFGQSLYYQQPALEVVMDRLPVTLYLAFVSVAISVLVSVPLGMAGGYRPGGLLDRLGIALATVGLAVPTFVIGIVLISVFAVQLGWLPAAGLKTNLGFVLPIASLVILGVGSLIRFSYSGTRETLSKPYVLLARAKGLSEFEVLRKHVLPVAILPVITFTGLQFGALMSGAVITESVFTIPGMGKLALDSILRRDHATIQAVVFVVAIAFILINILTDLLQTVLDPRLRIGMSR